MGLVSVDPAAAAAALLPLRLERAVHDARTAPAVRTVRVGVLGLGQVGQAVVRAMQASADLLHANGVRFRVDGALVRDPHRARRCPRVARITSNPAGFLRGRYDLVIEALGGTEPARTLVARLLGRGVPVVSANKALIAAHGDSLHAIAQRRGAAFRFEASALAGIPFLGQFARRPLVSSLQRVTGIVNGTSNYVLSRLEQGCPSFTHALHEAQTLGYAEPDATLDVTGRDAADKLVLLLRECAGAGIPAHALEVTGIDRVTPLDFAAAHALGATIKPLAHASLDEHGVDAWVGPALLPLRHPLAGVHGALNGIALSSRFVPDLFFSGPGAGPDVTAATMVDDAVEVVREGARAQTGASRGTRLPVRAGDTSWFIRVPRAVAAARAFDDEGITIARQHQSGDQEWVVTSPCSRERIERAVRSAGGAGLAVRGLEA